MIDILMAAYNGEKYIGEQIESILRQTYKDWRLIILDDCSTDSTADIAMEYSKKYSGKIKFYRNSKNSKSAKNAFFELFKHSESDYIMLCDQDDVWKENKIEITFNKMLESEKAYGKELPILVYTDLTVVDEKLNLINSSFYKMMKLNPNRSSINYILVQNIVTGCTAMFNKATLKYYTQNCQEILMHDWWLALIAASFGRLVYLDEKTILYRQHGGNQVGARNAKSLIFQFNKFVGLLHNKKDNEIIRTYKQAKAFYNSNKNLFDDKSKNIVYCYSSIKEEKKLKRISTIVKNRFYKNGFKRKLVQIIFC